jgi:hypothetical protein
LGFLEILLRYFASSLRFVHPRFRWFSGAEPASAVAERQLTTSHKRTSRSSDRAFFGVSTYGFALVEI